MGIQTCVVKVGRQSRYQIGNVIGETFDRIISGVLPYVEPVGRNQQEIVGIPSSPVCKDVAPRPSRPLRGSSKPVFYLRYGCQTTARVIQREVRIQSHFRSPITTSPGSIFTLQSSVKSSRPPSGGLAPSGLSGQSQHWAKRVWLGSACLASRPREHLLETGRDTRDDCGQSKPALTAGAVVDTSTSEAWLELPNLRWSIRDRSEFSMPGDDTRRSALSGLGPASPVRRPRDHARAVSSRRGSAHSAARAQAARARLPAPRR